MNPAADIWARLLELMKADMTSTTITTWFDDIVPVALEDDRYVIYSPTRFKRDIIASRYAQFIKKALFELFSAELDVVVLTENELTDYFAIGQCTPGVIAVNTATFIGRRQKGILGGIAATLGVVFPSLIIISVLAGLIANFAHLTWVQHAFAGIRVCVCVLIFNAVVKLWKSAIKDTWGWVIFLAVLGVSLFTPVSPVICVLCAAIIGIAVQTIGGQRA